MIIHLNDKPYEVKEGASLAAFIESLELKPQGIAIAVDAKAIPKNKWKETILSNNVKPVLIQAVSGR